MQPYFRTPDGKIAIFHGRAEDILPIIPDASLDLVITSPPYNMGLVPGGNGRGMYRPGASNKAGRFREGYGQHNDAMPQEEYDAWQRQIVGQCWRIIRETGAIYYNHRPRIEHGVVRLPLGLDFGGIPIREIITWDRGTGIDVNLRFYCSVYEWIILLAKPDFALVDVAASGTGNVWRLGMTHGNTGHPAPFPLSLPMRALTTTGARSVLDPHLGSGTTLRAAMDLGIEGIGIEVEERFCEQAARRLDQAPMFAAPRQAEPPPEQAPLL